jgi:hypothetical protein
MPSSSSGSGAGARARQDTAVIDAALRERKRDVLDTSTDRFERRLTEVDSGLRLEMSRLHASLVKWMFVFWIGQFGITLSVNAILSQR